MRSFVFLISIFAISLFSQELPRPVPSRYITDDYGPRNLRGAYDWHSGIDYRADTGTTITAVEGGNIVYIRPYSLPPIQITQICPGTKCVIWERE